MCYKIKRRVSEKHLKGVLIMTSVRKIKRIITALLAAAMIFAVIPFSTSAATGSVKEIFDFLVEEMDLTPAAACGVLANIECESDFNYNLVGDNGTSYGICQWHNERLSNMKSYCNRNGLDWESLEGQLYFLKYELSTNKSDTGYILDKLKGIKNNADGAYEAGYDWCYYFERPANKTSKADSRGTKAMNTYWPKYGAGYVASAETEVLPGDVNGDGKINSNDALMVVENSVGSRKFTSGQSKLGDVDGNGKVTSTDALIILNISTGKDSVKNYK